MTEQLQRAFDAVAQLPEPEQDRLAAWILEEVESERRWDELFARSGDALATHADRALAEHRAGGTRPLDPDEL